MSYLNCHLPPFKVYVDRGFFYNGKKHNGKLQRATVLSAKSLPGLATTFQVLLDNGVLRDKLPISAIRHSLCDWMEHYPLDYLQLWNSFSYNITYSEQPFLSGLRCGVYLKNKTWVKGTIYGTFDWSGETSSPADMSLCEHPDEHKSGHFIALDNGQFAIQPNNRIRVYESSFVTKPFPEKPDYEVCETFDNVEKSDKWVTEDTNRQFYELNEVDQ